VNSSGRVLACSGKGAFACGECNAKIIAAPQEHTPAIGAFFDRGEQTATEKRPLPCAGLHALDPMLAIANLIFYAGGLTKGRPTFCLLRNTLSGSPICHRRAVDLLSCLTEQAESPCRGERFAFWPPACHHVTFAPPSPPKPPK
jgi:hypothetical protein